MPKLFLQRMAVVVLGNARQNAVPNARLNVVLNTVRPVSLSCQAICLF
jgi:hypothetical protein